MITSLMTEAQQRELMIHAASTGCQCNDFDVGHKTERAG
jgi:hypothetical protein